MTDADADDPPPDDGDVPDGEIPQVPRPSIRKILFRIVFIVAALGISVWILVRTFDDLDLDEVLDAARSLNDAEIISLSSLWVLWIAAQGLLTASLVPGSGGAPRDRRVPGPGVDHVGGPGPSDLPIRYRMLTSWGRTTGDATLAVAAGGIFSIGIKLVLPVIAAIGLVVSDAPFERHVADGGDDLHDRRTRRGRARSRAGIGEAHRAGRTADRAGVVEGAAPAAQADARGPPDPDGRCTFQGRADAARPVAGRNVGHGADVGDEVRAAADVLRFTGVDETELPWTQVFVVFALVQGLTVFPITAGDAGVSEIAYIGMLTAAAGEEYVNQITAAILIFRILTWLSIIPVGLGVLGFWSLQLRRRDPSARPPDRSRRQNRCRSFSPNSNCTATRSATRPVMCSAMKRWCSGWSR